jgi:beta-lactamase regulating signal transducer with metallopeptidase domain
MSGPVTMSASPWIVAIGWMLLHSLWQGAGIAIALGVVLRALRCAPSQVRYLASCAAMVVLVALPIASLRRPPPPVRPDAVAETRIRLAVTPVAADRASTSPPVVLRLTDRMEPLLPAIVAGWLAGVGVFSLRLLGGWIQALRWVRCRTRPLADPWPDRFDRLKERLGVRRAVALLESAWVEVPMVVGWLRPAVLVPVAALSGLSVAELEAILAHELAHIRRYDYLVNVVQCVVEVLMFYHPAAWWISRTICRERESCCDDLAVAICGDRVVYARALAAMEGLRVPAFSPSTAANGGLLLARVRRVLNPQEESMNPVRILAGLAVVLAVVPLWVARAEGDQPASPRSAETPRPFPNRSFVDVLSEIAQEPPRPADTGLGSQLAGPPARPKKRRVVPAMALDTSVNGIRIEPVAEKPPTDAEVWAEFLKTQTESRPYYETRRENVQIVSEKTSQQVVEQLRFRNTQIIHRYYKCNVSYDETREMDHPIPLRNVEHKVADIVFDRPIRWPMPDPSDRAIWERVEARIDRLTREIEERKRQSRPDQLEQDPVYNRMLGELTGLTYLRDQWTTTNRTPSPKNP